MKVCVIPFGAVSPGIQLKTVKAKFKKVNKRKLNAP